MNIKNKYYNTNIFNRTQSIYVYNLLFIVKNKFKSIKNLIYNKLIMSS